MNKTLKFEKYIHGTELYAVLALVLLGFCLGLIVNLEINLNDINIQTWSTLGLLVIGIFTWLTSIKSVKIAKIAQQQAMFPFQNEVFQGMQEMISVVNTLGTSSVTEADVRRFIGCINLSRWCFPEHTDVYKKCKDFHDACIHIQGYRSNKCHEYERLEKIINYGLDSLMNDIYLEFTNNYIN